MSTVTFDTLKYAEALKTAGVPDAQAKAQAEALADALLQGGQDLATKAHIAELRMATKADIAEFRMATKADITELRTTLEGRLARLESDTGWVKWIVTGGVGLYVLRSIVDWIR